MAWFLMVPKMALHAWGLWLMWAWFILPLGAPHLGYWHAMGLDAALALITMGAVTKVEEDANTRIGLMITKMVAVPIVVGLGWIILQIWRAQ